MSLQTEAAAARDATFRDMVEAAALEAAQNVFTEATKLSVNIASGTAVTSIPITPALAAAITSGTVIAVDGDLFTATGTNNSGATAIGVTSKATTRDHRIGELVIPPTISNHVSRANLANGLAVTPDSARERFVWLLAGLGDTVNRIVTDGATTTGSPNVTSATAAFTGADVGKAIAATGIPAAATILSITSATTVVISANATATGSALALTIGTSDAVIRGHVSAVWDTVAG